MKQNSLGLAIKSGRSLTESEQSQVFAIVGAGCRAKNRERIARRLALPLSLWPNHSCFYRVHFDGDRVSYCAGQDYPAEVRELRAIILGGF